jgi:hypothetical protein
VTSVPHLDLPPTSQTSATGIPASVAKPHASLGGAAPAARKMLDVQTGADGSMVISTQGATFFAHHHYDKKGVLRGQGGGPLPMYVSVASTTPIVTGDGAAMVEVMLSMERCGHARHGPVGVLLPEANSMEPIFSRNPKILWNGVPVKVCDPLVSFVNEKLGSTPFSQWVFTVAKTVSKRFAGDSARQISWASGDGPVKNELKREKLEREKLEPYVTQILGVLKSSNLMSELPKDLVSVLTTLDHAVVQWGLDSGSNGDDIEAARNDAMEAFLVKSIASTIKRSAGPGEDPVAVNALDTACGKVLEGAGRGLATMMLKSSTSQLPVATQDKLRALKHADLSRSNDKTRGGRADKVKQGDVTGLSQNKHRSDTPGRALSHDSGVKKHFDAPLDSMLNVLDQEPAFQGLPGELRKLIRSVLGGLDAKAKPSDVETAAVDCVSLWLVANSDSSDSVQIRTDAFKAELANGFWRANLISMADGAKRAKPTFAPKEESEATESDSDLDSDDVLTDSSSDEGSSFEKMERVDAGTGATSGSESEHDEVRAPEAGNT